MHVFAYLKALCAIWHVRGSMLAAFALDAIWKRLQKGVNDLEKDAGSIQDESKRNEAMVLVRELKGLLHGGVSSIRMNGGKALEEVLIKLKDSPLGGKASTLLTMVNTILLNVGTRSELDVSVFF